MYELQQMLQSFQSNTALEDIVYSYFFRETTENKKPIKKVIQLQYKCASTQISCKIAKRKITKLKNNLDSLSPVKLFEQGLVFTP